VQSKKKANPKAHVPTAARTPRASPKVAGAPAGPPVSSAAAETGGGRKDRAEHLAKLADALRRQRKGRGLAIEQLAELSGVSRSMISKIERAEAVPSTSVLSQLAEALGVTFSQLLVEPEEQEIVVLPQRVQPVLRDRASGFTRRCISPILPGRGIDWLLNTLPVGSATGEFTAHRRGTDEYIFVLAGTLEARVGEHVRRLEAGDAVYFQATSTHEFRNLGTVDCQFFLVIDSTPFRR
jgi:transcriptional regulator with XRE-family HTH domain